MTPEETAIARRFLACQGFRWMPGMRTQHGERVLLRLSGGRLLVQPDDVQHDDGRNLETEGPCVVRADDGGPRQPDLDDPATLGCLLAMVRESWADPKIHIRWSAHWRSWYAYDGNCDQLNRLDGAPLGRFATEIEAILAALEAAP